MEIIMYDVLRSLGNDWKNDGLKHLDGTRLRRIIPYYELFFRYIYTKLI